MRQVSRTVSEESMSASKNSVRQGKPMRTVSIELDTSQNVDMSNPHLEQQQPPVQKPKRIITQPPFLSDQPAGQVNQRQLVEAAEEDKELDLNTAVMVNSGHSGVAMRAKNNSSDKATNDGTKQKPQARNTIALFENMNQLPPQPEVNKKTTVVVIQRDERSNPSSPTRENQSSDDFEPSKYNVEVLKFKGTTSDPDLSNETPSSPSKHTGSVEANLYSGVRKVATQANARNVVGSTEIRVQEEEDEDGEVRIVEIARLWEWYDERRFK